MTTNSKETVSALRTKWAFDESHAKVGFSVSHFGISETEGKFTKFKGEVEAAEPDFSDAKIHFIADVNSINTEDAQRDSHLKSPDFFDSASFPEITFKSKSLHATMRGITRQIELDVAYKGTVDDPFGNTKAGFKISGAVDRTEFGLTWNGVLAAGGLLVGNDVYLDINIELLKTSPAN